MNYVLREKFRPPAESLNLTEPLRAMTELAMLPLAESWLNSMQGGDGHPVIIIPGSRWETAQQLSCASFFHHWVIYPAAGNKVSILVFVLNFLKALVNYSINYITSMAAGSVWLVKALAVSTRGSWQNRILMPYVRSSHWVAHSMTRMVKHRISLISIRCLTLSTRQSLINSNSRNGKLVSHRLYQPPRFTASSMGFAIGGPVFSTVDMIESKTLKSTPAIPE